MKIPAVLLAVLLSVTAGAQAKKEILRQETHVYFDTDKYNIKNSELEKLNSVIDTIKKYKDCSIQLYGHTDSVASISYNEKLSENRLMSVEKYLADKGINTDKINTAYYGELKPAVPNSDDKNKAKNRRVEIIITRIVMIMDYQIEDEGCPEPDTTITLASGTQIVIPGCAFGEIDRNDICIEFKEAKTPSEISAHGLSTMTTSGEQLMSYGMFQMTVKNCKTGELVKNISDSIYVQFPYYGPSVGDGSSCISTSIGMYQMNGGGWEQMEESASIIERASKSLEKAANTADRFIRAPLATLNGQWVNCDVPIIPPYDGENVACVPNSTQSFKVRGYTLDRLFVTITYAEGINSREDYVLVQDGKKATTQINCGDCRGNAKIELWAWAHDNEGNKFVIKGGKLKNYKAKSSFKHCQTKFRGVIPGVFCIKRNGTVPRKYILKPKDFEPYVPEKKPETKPVIIRLS